MPFHTMGVAVKAIMDLERRVGALTATVHSHERRLRLMEQKRGEAPKWLSQLPLSEMALLAFLMLSGMVMHLMPPEWRDDLRAIITARANK